MDGIIMCDGTWSPPELPPNTASVNGREFAFDGDTIRHFVEIPIASMYPSYLMKGTYSLIEDIALLFVYSVVERHYPWRRFELLVQREKGAPLRHVFTRETFEECFHYTDSSHGERLVTTPS